MDDSVAATLKMNNANTCEIFSWLILKKQKFKIILKNIISIVNNNKRPTKLYVSDSEDNQSYLLWFGKSFNLETERTKKATYLE